MELRPLFVNEQHAARQKEVNDGNKTLSFLAIGR